MDSASLLDSASDLRGRLAQTDAVILQDLGNEIGTLIDAAATQDVRRVLSQRTSAAIFRFDQVARESAKSNLTGLLQCVGRLEALWSAGVATSEHGWTYPRPSSRLRAVGLYHPFLGRSAISNDLHLDDQVRVCFVTGPNMAGKSTFLKATAVAVLLAHTGSGVPAASMEFVPVGTVFSFAADATSDPPRFDYRLREGVSEQRLGMTLLRQEGVLDRLECSVKWDRVSSATPGTYYSR